MYAYWVPFTIQAVDVITKKGYVKVRADFDGVAVTKAHKKLARLFPGTVRVIHTPKIVKY